MKKLCTFFDNNNYYLIQFKSIKDWINSSFIFLCTKRKLAN